MIRITKETKLTQAEILDRIYGFFGNGGLGLEEKEWDPCCIFFEGDGGYVRVTLTEKGNERIVDVEARELEYWVQQFMEKLWPKGVVAQMRIHLYRLFLPFPYQHAHR